MAEPLRVPDGANSSEKSSPPSFMSMTVQSVSMAEQTTSTNRLSTSSLGMKGSLKVKIIKPYYEILTPIDGVQMLKHIESCGRICYKSEHKITEDSYLAFVKNTSSEGMKPSSNTSPCRSSSFATEAFPMRLSGIGLLLTVRSLPDM